MKNAAVNWLLGLYHKACSPLIPFVNLLYITYYIRQNLMESKIYPIVELKCQYNYPDALP